MPENQTEDREKLFYTDAEGNLRRTSDNLIVGRYERQGVHIGAAPWETPTGEGWLAPWTEMALTYDKEGNLIREKYDPERAKQYLTELTWTEAKYLTDLGVEIPLGVRVKPASPQEVEAESEAAITAAKEAAGISLTPAVSWDIITDEDTGYLVQVGYDEEGKVVDYVPLGGGRQEPTIYEPYAEEGAYAGYTFNPYTGEYEQPPGYISPYEERYLGIQEEELGYMRERDAARLALEKEQHLAQLAAQPISWLQYEAEAGTQAVGQPWMEELGGAAAGVQTGQPIPGFMGTQGMKGMPELLRPSAQYGARMGPQAWGQRLGYEQGRTGATPEETEFRHRATAPPSGRQAWLRHRK